MHSDLNQRIRQFVDKTESVTCLPDMKQAIGEWDTWKPEEYRHHCCFGARIAHALCKTRSVPGAPQYWQYTDGIDEITKQLQLPLYTIEILLQICGTGHVLPFGTINWLHTPSEVMQNFIKIERAPTDYEVKKLQIALRNRSVHVQF